MCVFVCMCVCVAHAYVWVCICMKVYVYLYVWGSVRMRVCIHVFIYNSKECNAGEVGSRASERGMPTCHRCGLSAASRFNFCYNSKAYFTKENPLVIPQWWRIPSSIKRILSSVIRCPIPCHRSRKQRDSCHMFLIFSTPGNRLRTRKKLRPCFVDQFYIFDFVWVGFWSRWFSLLMSRLILFKSTRYRVIGETVHLAMKCNLKKLIKLE